ncbi:MAG: hypothetical protein HRU32_03520 [Rhodobacteraceae bacterium]|nr:hypothetical protein [Paracoccaceae bacterium]
MRIDWAMLNAMCNADPNLELHLVGDASDAGEDLENLVKTGRCRCHGPMSERKLIEMLPDMDFALLPHQRDDASTFMNPIKLEMFREVGLWAITTAVPGLSPYDGLIIVEDADQATAEVRRLSARARAGTLDRVALPRAWPTQADDYLHIFNSLFE